MSSAPTYHSASEASTNTGNKWVLPVALVCVVAMVALLIWLLRGVPELDTAYGRRAGAEYRASVNGTLVFSEMFRQSGRDVTSIDKLSPKLNKYSTIVWFPDDFDIPNKDQRGQLELWLSGGSNRTLIYVGRDYDAAVAYWTRVLPTAPPEQAAEIKRKLAEAKSKFAEQRARLAKDQDADWFTMKEGSIRKVTKVDGKFAGASQLDPTKLDITLNSRMARPPVKPPMASNRPELVIETLLASEGDDLIYEITPKGSEWGYQGRIIVVTNGSMLLNYPLVNKENRKIASKLIAECSPNSPVGFLESGRDGPNIDEKESTKPDREWPFPMNAIVFHLVVLSIVYCLARSAIFGRPRELPVDSPSDFGKHIGALGKLMQRTKDQNYAYARLQQYRQHGKRDSGKTHKK